MTVSKELLKCKLDVVGVQVRWKGSGTEPAGVYTSFYGKGGTGVFYSVHKRIIGCHT
jgi:hypothetical protein